MSTSRTRQVFEIVPRLSLVTPAMVAARARANSSKRSQQSGPYLRRRGAAKKHHSDYLEDDEKSGGEDGEEDEEAGGPVDLGDTTDEEEGRGAATSTAAEDGRDEERHYGKRRMVGTYETQHLPVPRQLLQLREREKGEKFDNLIPIRIDLEHEGYKTKDLFTWNSNGELSWFFWFQ